MMDQKEKTRRRVEDLDVDSVVLLLDSCQMQEFQEFVTERNMDGRKLVGVTEGIVKLWKPKANTKKFMTFIQELKLNPEKYLEALKGNFTEANIEVIRPVEAQYQTVNVKKSREQNSTSNTIGVEELLKKIVPAKSFLYRHHPNKTDKPVTSYVPMDAGTPKKPKRFFRMSSYEYPHFDLKQFKLSKTENFNDRGYYSIKTNSAYCSQKIYKKPEPRTKYKSLSTPEELTEKFPEDHFYEDLCYNDVNKEDDNIKELKPSHMNVKPRMVKIQELFQFFKLPFLKKPEDVVEGENHLEVHTKSHDSEIKDGHIYENSDSIANMYDSIQVNRRENQTDDEKQAKLPVEDYLEPVQVNKEYCDVVRQRDDSILGYILSIFENRFGIRRETNDVEQSDDSEENKTASTLDIRKQPDDVRKQSDDAQCPTESAWKNMADRPLPVPVENESYYMDIERGEAENLLRGLPDGTFVLRPSSQPNHAYTLTVSCSNAVHNVGVRRRPDGRLSLGFARRGERSFATVGALLRHHRRRRLLLVAGGHVCGATTLNDTPHYYQTPRNLPLVL